MNGLERMLEFLFHSNVTTVKFSEDRRKFWIRALEHDILQLGWLQNRFCFVFLNQGVALNDFGFAKIARSKVELMKMRHLTMGGEGSLIVVDFVEQHEVFVIVRQKDVEPAATGLIGERATGIFPDHGQKSGHTAGPQMKRNGDDVWLHGRCAFACQ